MAMETSQCLICVSQHNLQSLYGQIHIAPVKEEKEIIKIMHFDETL